MLLRRPKEKKSVAEGKVLVLMVGFFGWLTKTAERGKLRRLKGEKVAAGVGGEQPALWRQ